MSAQFDWYTGNIDRALDTDVYDNPALLDGSVWDEFAASIRRVGDQLKRRTCRRHRSTWPQATAT